MEAATGLKSGCLCVEVAMGSRTFEWRLLVFMKGFGGALGRSITRVLSEIFSECGLSGWIWGCRCFRVQQEQACESFVGGGEDVGGWERTSWSLDVSPGLAASSPPIPPHPLSFCGSLIGSRTLNSSPEMADSPAQCPPNLFHWAGVDIGSYPNRLTF